MTRDRDLSRTSALARVDQLRARHDGVTYWWVEGVRQRMALGMDMSEIQTRVFWALSDPPLKIDRPGLTDWIASLLCRLAEHVPATVMDEWEGRGQ